MKKICEYTGEYCENAGNEPCIGCPNCGAKMELKELEGDHFTNVDKMGKE